LVDEEILFDYYDQRVPKHIYNGKAFEKWRKKHLSDNPKALLMTRSDLMQRDDSHVQINQYPDSIEVHGPLPHCTSLIPTVLTTSCLACCKTK